MNKKINILVISLITISSLLVGCKKDKNAKIPLDDNKTKISEEKKDKPTSIKEEMEQTEPKGDKNPAIEELSDVPNMTLGNFVKSIDIDSNLLSEVYNIENFINKDYQYNEDLNASSIDNGALNLTYDDYTKLVSHYEYEYMAKKYNIQYTLQDLIDYTKNITDVDNLKDISQMYQSSWQEIQNVGWKQYALAFEGDYVNEKMNEQAIEQGKKNLTEDQIKQAYNTYKDTLKEEYPTISDEDIYKRAVDLYVQTNTDWGNLETESALYARLKLLKTLQPEKYKELVKNEKNKTIEAIQSGVDLIEYE